MQMSALKAYDQTIYDAIKHEEKRQSDGMELIPSENYVSRPVLEAVGSLMTNKYSEGYVGKRYYGGQEYVDVIEQMAIDRAKQLFGAEHVNVQPYSGSPANTAVYFALLNYGDTVLGMKLDHGGHITHGLPISFSGRSYNFIGYGVEKETGRVNMEEVRKLAHEHKPKMIVAGFSAYSRNLEWKKFQEIAEEVGAITMADIAHIAGLIAAGVIDSPVPYFDVVTTTTHKTLRGPRGAMIMCKEKFTKAIDRAVFPGLQGGPHDHIIAGKAVAFKEALEPAFKDYSRQIITNAQTLAGDLIAKGFKIISDGTDNHLMLIDLTNKNITGKEAQEALDKAGITCNKNTVPFETRSPMDPSGIRLGTPAITTRGMKEEEMRQIAVWINDCIDNHKDEAFLAKVKEEVKTLCLKFPVPGAED
ncbi:MAG TPA: serine hydroxymethyltransferase [Candidatus Gracilibacteria bacterium]|nr:serine hydroxymethyltransferase [Candidatus Gracilibacteria bacterium]